MLQSILSIHDKYIQLLSNAKFQCNTVRAQFCTEPMYKLLVFHCETRNEMKFLTWRVSCTCTCTHTHTHTHTHTIHVCAPEHDSLPLPSHYTKYTGKFPAKLLSPVPLHSVNHISLSGWALYTCDDINLPRPHTRAPYAHSHSPKVFFLYIHCFEQTQIQRNNEKQIQRYKEMLMNHPTHQLGIDIGPNCDPKQVYGKNQKRLLT